MTDTLKERAEQFWDKRYEPLVREICEDFNKKMRGLEMELMSCRYLIKDQSDYIESLKNKSQEGE